MKRNVALALAALGLALSIALEVLHVRAYLLPSSSAFCALGEKLDCTAVALSHFSVLLNVPVPLWGALGFLSIGVAVYLRSRWFLPLASAALFGSVALLGVELLAIGAFCLLCEAVHVTALALFVLALRSRRETLAPLGEPKHRLYVLGVPALLWLSIALFVPRYWGVFGWKGAPAYPSGKTTEGYPWVGAKEPKVTVHEFTDYRCVFCKAAATRSLRLLSEHPGSLRIVRRQFPRQRCPTRANFACVALRLAYCAEEQGKFWQADRWLFSKAGRPGLYKPEEFARDLGIDLTKLTSCLEREAIVLRAAEEAQYALDQGFKGAPSFVVDGKPVTEEELVKLVTELP